MRNTLRLSILLVSALLLGACGKSGAVSSTVSPTEPPVETQPETATPSARPTRPATASPTVTITPTITLTPAITQTPTITWSPAPTLAPEAAAGQIAQLREDNGGCRLPCWMGITPGQTTWQEAEAFFQTFSVIENYEPIHTKLHDEEIVITGHIIHLIPGEDSRVWGAGISDQDGIVSMISVDPVAARSGGFGLSRILDEIGEPDQVYAGFGNFPDVKKAFMMVLYYAKENVFIYYDGVEAEVHDQIVCIQPEDLDLNLFMWSDQSRFELPDQEFPYQERFSEQVTPKTIEEDIGLDVHTFYTTFVEHDPEDILCAPVNW